MTSPDLLFLFEVWVNSIFKITQMSFYKKRSICKAFEESVWRLEYGSVDDRKMQNEWFSIRKSIKSVLSAQ